METISPYKIVNYGLNSHWKYSYLVFNLCFEYILLIKIEGTIL